MKVVIIAGSIRSERQSIKVALLIDELIANKNIESILIDLAETALPLMGIENKDSGNVETIRATLNGADAMIIVSPEYHGSFPGVLKNMLDHYWTEFHKKPIGVATASSGRLGGINASTQLQQLILSLGAYPVPLKLIVPEVQDAFDDQLKPRQEWLINAANKFIEEFLWFAEIFVHGKKFYTRTKHGYKS
jgi:NAD(P)H-dependent FMN reductase